jgi:acyl-CoA synthetase (AMP-forming)/AMP-acid ligase II
MQTIMTALLTGGTLVFLNGRFDAAEVLRIIEEENVRVWGAVPTMITRVLDHPDLAVRDTSSLSSLTIGGSFVPPELLERARAAFPTARRRTGTVYGMTEAGGGLTAVAGTDMEERPGTVGRALPTVDLQIIDPDEKGVGEILARSPTLMDGYLGCPDDPILTDDGWLHTGDLGRIDADGYLFVLGRCKDIVIRGGENIACPHVEAAILTHPEVQHAAVLGIPDPEYGEQVAAVVVRRPGSLVSGDDLVLHVKDRLGYFQVPTLWWIRDEPLPTNATGKVKKRDLQRDWPTPPTTDTRAPIDANASASGEG